MDRFAEQPLGSFLDEVAAPTPAPGGGSAAATACALGAALVEMVARIGLGRADAAVRPRRDLPDRLAALRGQALKLAERELWSYGPVLEALRLPRDDPERAGRLDAALTRASMARSPLRRLRPRWPRSGPSWRPRRVRPSVATPSPGC